MKTDVHLSPINKEEIIMYQLDDSIRLEVRIEGDTMWLNRQQMAMLFDRDVKTTGKHVSNALKEELSDFPVVANFATTAKDGKTYQVEYYNLDMILSVGYRVKSKRGIVLIDNYIDESVLLMLAKRNEGVPAEIVTKQLSETLTLDIEQHNRQYPHINIRESPRYHDRFLIVDDTVYHIGASLKDLGKKLFAFSRMEIDMRQVLVPRTLPRDG